MERVWESRSFDALGPPAITNGIVFAISAGPKLMAFDAATGRQLYSSGDAIASHAAASPVALANGHACFTTAEGALYCFGLPME